MDIQKIADRVTDKASEIFNNVAQYTEEKRTICRLKTDLYNSKEELNMLFAELGRLTYHGNSASAGVRSKDLILADIESMNKTIANLEEALAELFVKPVQDEPPAETITVQSQSYCHKCGNPQSGDNDFCPKCGTKLIKE